MGKAVYQIKLKTIDPMHINEGIGMTWGVLSVFALSPQHAFLILCDYFVKQYGAETYYGRFLQCEEVVVKDVGSLIGTARQDW